MRKSQLKSKTHAVEEWVLLSDFGILRNLCDKRSNLQTQAKKHCSCEKEHITSSLFRKNGDKMSGFLKIDVYNLEIRLFKKVNIRQMLRITGQEGKLALTRPC